MTCQYTLKKVRANCFQDQWNFPASEKPFATPCHSPPASRLNHTSARPDPFCVTLTSLTSIVVFFTSVQLTEPRQPPLLPGPFIPPFPQRPPKFDPSGQQNKPSVATHLHFCLFSLYGHSWPKSELPAPSGVLLARDRWPEKPCTNH